MLPTRSIRVEVIAPVLESWGLCTACELVMSQANVGATTSNGALDEYPREWQEDFQRLSSWVFELADRYRDQVKLVVIDPRSLRGLLKSLRYWVRRTPTWIVDGKRKVVGWDREELEQAIEEATGRPTVVAGEQQKEELGQ